MQKEYSYFTFLLLFPFCWSLESYPSYPLCNDTSLDNNGLYFDERDGIRYWNHCQFPNPRVQVRTCGRDDRFGDVYDLCNIEYFFSSDEATELDTLMAKIGAETSNRCDVNGEKMNTTVSLVAVNNIRTVYLGNTEDICINNCGQYFPELVNVSLATDEEVQFSVDVFAQRLAESWGSVLCDTTVTVVYWHGKKIIGTGVPKKLQGKLKWSEVIEIRNIAQQRYFNNGSYVKEGLVYVLNEYNKQLQDTPPAYWILCIAILILILFSLLMAWYLISGGTSDQFNDSTTVDFLGLLFRIVTGIIMFEILLRCMLFMDKTITWWHAIIFSAITFVAFASLISLTM